jgi:hypothetical protein
MIGVGRLFAGQYGRAFRLHEETADRWIMLLERGSATGKGAACAGKVAEGVKQPTRLLNDFACRVQVMGALVT